MIASSYDLLRQKSELWDLFTRKDDYFRDKAVEHRSLYSLDRQGDIISAPVSRYLCELGMQWEYPEGKRFCVCLTHDIDDVYPPGLNMLLSSAVDAASLDLDGAMRQLAWRLKGKQYSPYRNFREIIGLEKAYGGESSFYFMATNRDIKRFRYLVEELESDLGCIVDAGCEVGLHGGYYTYCSLEEMAREKRRLEKVLGKPVHGYRNHYLSFKVPDTWELLSKAGFGYDTTLGYNDRPGFRNGMCHPFRPFNLNTGRPVDIVEIPLAIMDDSLFSAARSFRQAWALSRQLIDSAARCGGVITLLWHNNVFSEAFRETWKKMYVKLLQYCREKNAWITSGEQIWQWSVKHGYLDH